MTEELDNEQGEQEEETPKSLWEMLNENEEHHSEEKYDEEQAEQDEEIAKQGKLERKLSSKMDNLTKKFEQTMLRERISKFESESDELTLEMFKSVASDVKTLEDFDKAVSIVKSQAKKLEETAQKYRERFEKEAATEAAKAWGTGPIGTPTPRGESDLKERDEAIARGDTHAALAALMEDDPLMGGRL